jgi:hypothetical protein
MIPAFNENGYLPPGIHKASLDEIADRFGRQSETRVAEMDSIRWLIDLVRGTGVERIILNGSFATAVQEPNDVDCVLLVNDAFFEDPTLDAALEDGFPFLEIEVVDRRAFDYFVESFFALDKKDIPKGMLEVIL